VKPRTWTLLFALVVAAWIGLAGLLQQSGQPPVAEAYTPAMVAPDDVPAPAYSIAAELHDYLADLDPHWRVLPDVAALERLMAVDPLLIDVRDHEAYLAGHLPGAVNIPLAELTERLAHLPSDRLIVVNCAGGLRSAYAATALELLGFANVYDFTPGFSGWLAAGNPISTSDVPPPALSAALPVDAAVHASIAQFFATLPIDAYGIAHATALEQLIVQRDALVVDLRDADAFAGGRIPGSVNIPLDQLGANLDRLPFDRPIVLSCNADTSCGAAAPALHMLGFSNVRVFPASFAGWEAAHLLVER
jgi:rhodanese-related sulfurtransferase